jgi:hypothetical protein
MPIQKLKRKPKNRKVVNAQPQKIDGYNFRSKLEVYCYEKLVKAGLSFKYEEDKFYLMQPFTFPNSSWELIKKKGLKVFDKAGNNVRAITYTPDFTNLDEGWVIECKGNPNDAFPLRWKLFKKHIYDEGLNYDLYLPRNRNQVDKAIETIKRNRK